MTFDVTAKHPRYLEFLPAWRKMRDAIGGEDDVKAAGETYLRMKTGMHAIKDPNERAAAYASYKDRAEFPEIVAPTMTGQVGLMNAQPPTYELPRQLEPMRERATRDGLTLDGLVERVTSELLAAGRYGLLPTFDRRGPYIACYPAESITNWDDDEAELNYVALDESREARDPATNTWGLRQQFRELFMLDGRFQSLTWRQVGPGGALVSGSPEGGVVSSTSGKPLDWIPFVLLGTRSLSIDPDDAPLYGLANIALRMYRLDADYMQSLHMTSEPTPWVNGFADPVRAMAAGQIPRSIGAANMWVLPPDAQCGFLEFSGPGLQAQRAAIDAAREAAATFGARMFDETRRAPESGESRRARYTNETSVLKTIAKVACSGVEKALRMQARWMGIDEKTVSVTPNLDWVTDAMTPAELTALVKSWHDGAISYATLFARLQAGKVVDAGKPIEDEINDILADPLREDMEEPDPADPESGNLPLAQPGAASPTP